MYSYRKKIQSLDVENKKHWCVKVSCWAHRLVQVVSHRVCQCSNGIIKNEQVLVLIFPKSKNQCVKDETQVRDQLGTCLLLQGCKCTLKEQHIDNCNKKKKKELE